VRGLRSRRTLLALLGLPAGREERRAGADRTRRWRSGGAPGCPRRGLTLPGPVVPAEASGAARLGLPGVLPPEPRFPRRTRPATCQSLGNYSHPNVGMPRSPEGWETAMTVPSQVRRKSLAGHCSSRPAVVQARKGCRFNGHAASSPRLKNEAPSGPAGLERKINESNKKTNQGRGSEIKEHGVRRRGQPRRMQMPVPFQASEGALLFASFSPQTCNSGVKSHLRGNNPRNSKMNPQVNQR
jgi:hypothetical protein